MATPLAYNEDFNGGTWNPHPDRPEVNGQPYPLRAWEGQSIGGLTFHTHDSTGAALRVRGGETWILENDLSDGVEMPAGYTLAATPADHITGGMWFRTQNRDTAGMEVRFLDTLSYPGTDITVAGFRVSGTNSRQGYIGG